MDDWCKQYVHFIVECHGALLPKSANASQTTHVSSHWIRSCLEVYQTYLKQMIFFFQILYFYFFTILNFLVVNKINLYANFSLWESLRQH